MYYVITMPADYIVPNRSTYASMVRTCKYYSFLIRCPGLLMTSNRVLLQTSLSNIVKKMPEIFWHSRRFEIIKSPNSTYVMHFDIMNKDRPFPFEYQGRPHWSYLTLYEIEAKRKRIMSPISAGDVCMYGHYQDVYQRISWTLTR